jgi:catechol 2,3-dioxygenase-like lactoylglutathione lyase family enzyme
MSVAERISHLELECTDLARSRDFYTRAVGLRLRAETPGSHAVLEVPSGQLLLLRQVETIVPKGMVVSRFESGPHYAFFVEPGEWYALLRQLDAEGVPWNDREHAAARPGGEAGAYFSDPDGYTVQLITAGLPG